MRNFVIYENDAGQRVDKFLMKTMPKLPKSLMYKSIRNKKIKVNRKRCEISQRLEVDDEVQCFISEEFFENDIDTSFLNVKGQLDIVYEDENIIIMNKEVGLLVHSNEHEQVETLVNRMKFYLYSKNEYDYTLQQSFAPSLCHRIDRNTQGFVIGAKNAQALRSMNEAIKLHCLQKKYLCIVEGKMDTKEACVSAYHKKENQQVDICWKYREGYKEIITKYKVLKESKGLSFVEVELISGKSHQIRALFAFLNHPLYGDTRYRAKKREYPYQALCAYKLHFNDMPKPLENLNGKQFEIKDIDFLSIL